MKKLFALRGATCAQNTETDIAAQVAALYDALLEANKLPPDDIVSLIFSVTPDLDAKNPAAALRKTGRAATVPLFAVAEAPPLILPHCIRVLIHCYMGENSVPHHIYCNGAEILRPDIVKE
jgi:chorismate mutase